MGNIFLNKYGNIISDHETGQKVYNEIIHELDQKGTTIIDFSNLKSMATFNAKQIFGKLYLQLGADNFFSKITILNASDDLKLIITLGIQSALEDK